MGSLAGAAQLKEVTEKVEQLSQNTKNCYGYFENFEVKGADKNKGAFMSPILFLNNKRLLKIKIVITLKLLAL
jgi:oxepin-CoA hydrolase/3-oxo-5,6-dehydrosuberyl-CoA semialdehyde dehydrogenase